MRDRMQSIAGSLLSSHLSDPSAARGQAIGVLGQALAQRAITERCGEALIALGAMLVIALCGVLLFKHHRHHVDQWRGWAALRTDTPRVAGARATPMAGTILSRSGQSRLAATFELAGSHALLCLAAAFAIGLATSSAAATVARSPVGTWSTANGHGVIAITQCGDALCGHIAGIDRKPTEPMPTDVNGRSQCGLTIITDERRQANGTWLGQITDPRDGGVYQAKLWLDSDGNLRLRGFIGIPALGATQTWHPFTGHLTAACGVAQVSASNAKENDHVD
jgi:uncharacterized protein (DUF2147 family)